MNKISLRDLQQMVNDGIISLPKSVLERVNVSNISVSDLPEFAPYRPLLGNPISISEASRNYKIAQPTISGWVARKHIPILGIGANRTKFIDEGMIAYYSAKYKMIATRGRRTDNLLFGEMTLNIPVATVPLSATIQDKPKARRVKR